MDKRVMDIADKAAAGERPTHGDVLHLLGFDAHSPEAAYVEVRAREMALRAANGRGFIYAQIGVDANPCPENCLFCSFAAVNTEAGGADDAAGNSRNPGTGEEGLKKARLSGESQGGDRGGSPEGISRSGDYGGSSNGVSQGGDCDGSPEGISRDGDRDGSPEDAFWEVPLDRIVSYARLFDEEGVHLISLMATAGLPFSRYLEMVAAVRAAVSADMPIMANAADMTLEQALALKEAGAQAVYHAIRLGEGELTDISPDRRRETIAAARKAGLALMTGVEPLWDGASHEEIASRMEEVATLSPFCTGACSLIAAKGTEMENCIPATRARVRYVGAITRLVVGEGVPVGGAGGIAWVDAGCDPRARKLGLEPEWLRREVARARGLLEADEWHVPARAMWPVY